MKGKSLNEFIEGLYYNAEMEFIYKGKQYLITGYLSGEDYTIEMTDIKDGKEIFSTSDQSRQTCVATFEKARIFGGLTIFEAEDEIEVLYG